MVRRVTPIDYSIYRSTEYRPAGGNRIWSLKMVQNSDPQVMISLNSRACKNQIRLITCVPVSKIDGTPVIRCNDGVFSGISDMYLS